MGIKNINDLPILTETGENTKVLATDNGAAKLVNVNLLSSKKDLEPVFYIGDSSYGDCFTNEDGSQISKTEFERNIFNGVAYVLSAPSSVDRQNALDEYHNTGSLINALQNKHIYCLKIEGFINYGQELVVLMSDNGSWRVSAFNLKD